MVAFLNCLTTLHLGRSLSYLVFQAGQTYPFYSMSSQALL